MGIEVRDEDDNSILGVVMLCVSVMSFVLVLLISFILVLCCEFVLLLVELFICLSISSIIDSIELLLINRILLSEQVSDDSWDDFDEYDVAAFVGEDDSKGSELWFELFFGILFGLSFRL